MMVRTIVHVDMDAFFSSIEQMDFEEYRNRPVVVGADPQGGHGRGVVSAASYEARSFGIHSAMPISRAYSLCPDAVFVRPRMERYQELSYRVMGTLREFSPLVEQISIDEAFLDCTGTSRLIGPPPVLGARIKERIRDETTLTASVGIASNKSVAKIASDLEKPDGLVICPPGGEKAFLSGLPLRSLWGAGRKTVERLRMLGYGTIGEVANSSPENLLREFGKAGRHLWELANGIDEREVSVGWERKSISEETTFERDVGSEDFIEHVIFRLADSISQKMRMQGMSGRTITVKIRLSGFLTFTRSRTIPNRVNDTDTIRAVSTELFRNFDRNGRKVRLIGVGVSGLGDTHGSQLDLFGGGVKTNSTADRVLDEMHRRYGGKVMRAAFLADKGRRSRSTSTETDRRHPGPHTEG
jgi:DNA polymerase-4